MTKKSMNETANLYALEMLGKEQYDKNKTAVRSIIEDWTKGFFYAERYYMGEIEKQKWLEENEWQYGKITKVEQL